jgi:MYXO-CTERM domain-containing protein
MYSRLRRGLVHALCVAGFLLASGGTAPAALLTYEVSVNGIANGPFAGQSATAQFSFDDSVIPAGGDGNLLDFAGLDLPDLSVSFGTKSFTEANSDGGVLDFHNGNLIGFFLGGELNGLFAQFSGTDDFYLFVNPVQQEFGYTVAGDTSPTHVTATGITFRLVSVPEPSASTLAVVGLLVAAGLGMRRRVLGAQA